MARKLLTKILAAALAVPLLASGLTTPAQAESKPYPRFYQVPSSLDVKDFEFTLKDPSGQQPDVVLKKGGLTSKYLYPGWKVTGSLTLMPGQFRECDRGLPLNNFTVTLDGERENASLVYSIADYELKQDDSDIIQCGNSESYLNVRYALNGGNWTDKNYPSNTDIAVAPGETVYKPSDPVHAGHKFLGWEEVDDKTLAGTKADKPYDFSESAPDNPTDYAKMLQNLGRSFTLRAKWEKENNTTKFVRPKNESFEEFNLVASNPNNPSENMVLNDPGKEYNIPKGWEINGTIKMVPNMRLDHTGDEVNIKVSDFEITATVDPDDFEKINYIYTLKHFKPRGDISMYEMITVPIDTVSYHLNGGTWTDVKRVPTSNYGLGQTDTEKQMHLVPGETVYKPTDPVRDGFFFRGWSAISQLSDEAQDSKNPKVFGIDEYKFDETAKADFKVRGKLVHVYANWAKIVGQNKVISVGDSFDPKDLIATVVDQSGNALSKDDVVVEGDYKTDTVGTYELSLRYKDAKNGDPVKVTLYVNPKLEVTDKEIEFGDENFDLSSMITNEPGKEVKIDKGSFNPNKAGTYQITFTVIGEDGTPIVKTANVTVKHPKPALAVHDVEIWEGESFKLADMIDAEKTNGVAVPDLNAPFNTAVAGEYPINFTVTNPDGVETTETAKLIVKKRLTPLTPAPVLEVKDLEIWEGDPVDLSSMVTKAEGGKALANPDSKFDANKAGTYPIEFTVTGENGAKTTKSANLIVKKRLTPLNPCPGPRSQGPGDLGR